MKYIEIQKPVQNSTEYLGKGKGSVEKWDYIAACGFNWGSKDLWGFWHAKGPKIENTSEGQLLKYINLIADGANK